MVMSLRPDDHVDLSLLQPNDAFEGAIVRIESRLRVMGKKLAFFDARQKSPRHKYSCCVSGDDDLVATAARLMKNDDDSNGRRRPVVGGFCRVAGVLREGSRVDVASVELLRDDDGPSSPPSTEPPSPPENGRSPRRYRLPGIPDDPSGERVLNQDHHLLRRILGFVPLEEFETCVTKVNPLWRDAGLFLLERDYQRVAWVSLEDNLYEIFQSARHMVYNLGRNRGTGFADNEDDCAEFFLAGRHLCDLSLLNGNERLLRDVYVRKDVVEILGLAEEENRPRGYGSTRTYSTSHLKFLGAGCVQLSRLSVAKETSELQLIGYVFHNIPKRLPLYMSREVWPAMLDEKGLLCDELRRIGESMYGIDWYWRALIDHH